MRLITAISILPLATVACGERNEPAESPMTDANPAVMAKTIRPYGSWRSPIGAADLVTNFRGFSELQTDAGNLYWREFRPEEHGRYVIMRRSSAGDVEQITPEGYNVRTRVHEYGGGAFFAVAGSVFFSNYSDQRLYRQRAGEEPVAITPESGGNFRYADCVPDLARERILCVREDHSGPGEAVNAIVAVALSGESAGDVLFADGDFVAAPRLSPDARTLAFISWDHPNMPWDNTALWVAEFDTDGALPAPVRVNCGIDEAVMAPRYSPGGELFVLTDREEYWGLFRADTSGLRKVFVGDYELGAPAWVFDRGVYGFSADRGAIAIANQRGSETLVAIDLVSGETTRPDLPFVSLESVALADDGQTAYAAVGFADRAHALVAVNLKDWSISSIREGAPTTLAPGDVSTAKLVAYPSGGAETAYGFYYPPANAKFVGPAGELPPLIVTVHGGPTSSSDPRFSLDKQYWTSRGFAFLDVNYRGSTGFGRTYRHRLFDQWGVVDIEDTVNGAQYLVSEGLADPARLIIRGGSAGGFTTLAALAFHDVFAAGANYFGVSDLEALTKDTHKFESRYLDRLVGPYPERADLYRARSPIHHLDGFTRPLIIFQGTEDQIVPVSQSLEIFEGLRERGLPVAYIEFEGEQHGFRKAENIIRSREAELYFYSAVFGFETAEKIEPVQIHGRE